MLPAVFLDRDDTLIHNDGDLGDPDQVRLMPGVPEGLRALRRAGFRLVVVTNQGGVARGRYTEDDVDLVHRRIAELVDEAAGEADLLERFYYCPYHPDAAVAAYRRDHFWRKPRPGMLLQAARDLDLDLGSSWLIGDRPRDVEAGRTAGCRTILLSAEGPESEDCRPTAVAGDFIAAVRHVLKHAGPRPVESPAPAAEPAGSPVLIGGPTPTGGDETAASGGGTGTAVLSPPPRTSASPAAAVTTTAAATPRESRPSRESRRGGRTATGTDTARGGGQASGTAATSPATGPGVASVSAVSDQTAAELRQAIGELVEEVRAERMRRAEFGGLRLVAGLMQLLVVLLALLAVLQTGPGDMFFRWMAGAGLVQVAVVALLLADARS
ncbi:MAG: HAD-IIIA family hydrolase [Planctomycetota bacterium]